MTSSMNINTPKVDMTWLEQYRRITVIGLGMSGVGVVKSLTDKGFCVDIQDSRSTPPGLSEVEQLANVGAIHLGEFNQAALLESDLLIVSPGVSLQTPEIQQAINAGVQISGDIDIVSRSINIPLVVITGSNGKSTVTQLAGELCEAAGFKTFIGGNIGLSAMELLDEQAAYEIAILELSSFQLETTLELCAHSAVVLNLSPDHLDRYDGFQEYAQTKLAVYNNAKHIVWNRDDVWLQNIEMLQSNKVVSFGLNSPTSDNDFGIITDTDGQSWLSKGSEKLISTQDSCLLGDHNKANFLAVLALLDSFGIELNISKNAIADFSGLPHRMQFVKELDGVTWINDSKATNIGATQAAIEGLKGNIVLIAGGQTKGADVAELLPVLKQYVSRVFLFGEDAQKMHAAWKTDVQCTMVDSLAQAVSSAKEASKESQYVLFAPACASLDMFPNYIERGNQFMELVNSL